MRLTAGGDATGLTITDFDLSYTRNGAATAAKADVTDLASASAAHTDNGGFEVDPTDCPGLHRFDFPDAAFAAGVRDVLCTIKHTSCFTETLRVEIDGEVSVTEWNGVKLATTNPLPNAAADAAGGLPISDAGGLDLDTKLAETNEVTAARMGALTDWINGGRLDLILDIIAADVVNLDGAAMRGTDNAALASVCTEARLAELDAANLPADVDAILVDTAALGKRVTLSGTANAGDTTVKITLTGGVATDNYYNGQLVVITGGTGVGQSRTILNYVAAGTVATPTRDWAVAPDGTSTFAVFGDDVPAILEAGVATAGAAGTITLDAAASTTVDLYKNNFIMLTGGTGAGQTRLIGAYSAGRVATITPNWTTTPDATSIYQVLPAARVDVGGWLGNLVTGDGDWAALKADTAATLVDTAEIGAAGAGLTEAGGTGDHLTALATAANLTTVDTVVDGIQSDLSNGTDGLGALKTLIDALNDVSGADVLTQVNAALDTAIAELGVGAPTDTPTIRTGLMLLYMMAINKLNGQTSGTDAIEVHNAAGTMIFKKLITDSAGDYSEAKAVSA
jgi:hypothetical protein